MSAASHYSFGPYTIVTATRELWLGAATHRLPPKVFDLLVYLIEQRHKVVSKEELLLQLWKGAKVSDNAVQRTIAKLRAVIDARGGMDDACIRTIHRIGYRFVTPVRVGTAAQLPPVVGWPGLAALPLEGRSADEHPDWAELGLLVLTTRGSADDPRQNVRPGSHLPGSPPRGLQRTTLDEHASSLARLAGVEYVLSGRVDRHPAGFTLSYRLLSVGGAPRTGRVEGAQLIDLAHRLVDEVVFLLGPKPRLPPVL